MPACGPSCCRHSSNPKPLRHLKPLTASARPAHGLQTGHTSLSSTQLLGTNKNGTEGPIIGCQMSKLQPCAGISQQAQVLQKQVRMRPARCYQFQTCKPWTGTCPMLSISDKQPLCRDVCHWWLVQPPVTRLGGCDHHIATSATAHSTVWEHSFQTQGPCNSTPSHNIWTWP